MPKVTRVGHVIDATIVGDGVSEGLTHIVVERGGNKGPEMYITGTAAEAMELQQGDAGEGRTRKAYALNIRRNGKES